MSNVPHPKNRIRLMAIEAKERLSKNFYDQSDVFLAPSKQDTLSERQVYIKLKKLLENGEEIINPIKQLADEEAMGSMSHEERQRYIFQLSSDYLAMRRELLEKLAASDRVEHSAAF